MADMTGQVAVVTGGARGIGRAISERLAARGMKVAVGYSSGKDTAEELAGDDDLRAEVQAAIDDGNSAVSKAESVRQFRILTSDFTEDSGELTPTMKLKRNVIADQRADDIEAVYAQR